MEIETLVTKVGCEVQIARGVDGHERHTTGAGDLCIRFEGIIILRLLIARFINPLQTEAKFEQRWMLV